MRFIYLVVLSLITNLQLSAQQVIPVVRSSYEYFIKIRNVETRNDVRYIENKIRQSRNVISLESNRFPVRYFILKTSQPVTREWFVNYLDNLRYTIELFGQGEKAKENAILQFNKQKAGR